MWSGTKNGKFSISSAYHSIREIGSSGVGGGGAGALIGWE